MKFLSFSLVIVCFFFNEWVWANLPLPRQLTAKDRRSALEILGPATSARLLSSTYPLGGWEGFEVSLSRNYVPASYLSALGDQSTPQRDFDYPLLTFGKGLFSDVDLHVSFVPMIQKESLSHASAQIRHQFWQSPTNIFRLSGLLHASTTNINNQLQMQGYGYNLVGTTTIDQISLFIGIGQFTTRGRFIGGLRGITESLNTEKESLSMAHQLIGLEWLTGHYFLAAEVDRFESPYYSLRLGYRL